MRHNSNISINTLDMNALNIAFKWNKLSGWIKKQDPPICCLQETQLRFKDINRLKWWEMLFRIVYSLVNKTGLTINWKDRNYKKYGVWLWHVYNRKKSEKAINIWKTNKALLHNSWFKENITGESKNILN